MESIASQIRALQDAQGWTDATLTTILILALETANREHPIAIQDILADVNDFAIDEDDEDEAYLDMLWAEE